MKISLSSADITNKSSYLFRGSNDSIVLEKTTQAYLEKATQDMYKLVGKYYS